MKGVKLFNGRGQCIGTMTWYSIISTGLMADTKLYEFIFRMDNESKDTITLKNMKTTLRGDVVHIVKEGGGIVVKLHVK